MIHYNNGVKIYEIIVSQSSHNVILELSSKARATRTRTLPIERTCVLRLYGPFLGKWLIFYRNDQHVENNEIRNITIIAFPSKALLLSTCWSNLMFFLRLRPFKSRKRSLKSLVKSARRVPEWATPILAVLSLYCQQGRNLIFFEPHKNWHFQLLQLQVTTIFGWEMKFEHVILWSSNLREHA